MVAFSSATQGWFIKKANIIQRLLFLAVVPLMFVPNLMVEYLYLPNEYISWAIGSGIIAIIYFWQKMELKKESNELN
jgi:TRAP-type uncharacterized transport system fused permease subunit